MLIKICAVGKMRGSVLDEGFRMYVARLRWPVEVAEIDVMSFKEPVVQKKSETAALLAKVPGKSKVVLLDPGGDNIASEEMANLLASTLNEGKGLTFLIGGPQGLDHSLCPPLSPKIAFGRATWPHLLARVMLVEQLYRAQEILANRRYHHS